VHRKRDKLYLNVVINCCCVLRNYFPEKLNKSLSLGFPLSGFFPGLCPKFLCHLMLSLIVVPVISAA
jgi:hypothetical protein